MQKNPKLNPNAEEKPRARQEADGGGDQKTGMGARMEELSTGQSWRVWTDQRREAEIGSFGLEESKEEEWPTAAWGKGSG